MANIYRRKQLWKTILLVVGVIIILASFWYTKTLVEDIAAEERNSVKIWAEALKKKARLVSYTDQLFNDLRIEERKKVKMLVEATKRLSGDSPNIDITFLTQILQDNTTVPVIWTDNEGRVKSHRNLDPEIEHTTKQLSDEVLRMGSKYKPIEIVYLNNQIDYLYYDDSRIFAELKHTFSDLEESFISEVVSNSASVPVIITDSSRTKIIAWGNMDSTVLEDSMNHQIIITELASQNRPIEISLQKGHTNFIYYKDSAILIQLKYYPFIQFGVIGIFILIGYVLFSTSRRAEQNQVWVGMAKETAHQLGTPLSSLMGWVEYMKAKKTDPVMAEELQKDVDRLQTITERFSKIGSLPELKSQNVKQALEPILAYMKTRSSKKVNFVLHENGSNIHAMLNVPLFHWVIENLVRNAVDAMAGKGKIEFGITENDQFVFLDIVDTGKGMSPKKKKDVFKPGYTTKGRGWGLGLTLTKRIVEDYHKGKVVVKHTKINEGTTFRITLSKSEKKSVS
tara:strand:+ start:186 stop:1715 length:1530 start_codon:yes stop_codon:yes gene_type:complete